MPSPQAIDVMKRLTTAHTPTLDAAGIKFMRELYAEVAPKPPEDTKMIDTSVNGIPAAWVLAPNSEPDRRIVLFHGGAFVSCSRVSHGGLASHLARVCHAAVLLPEYRLAPEHVFPAALDDCLTAYEWALVSGPNGTAPVRSLAMVGDASGGWLTLAALLRLRDNRKPLPVAAATLSAWTDLSLTGESVRTRAEADPFLSEALLRFCASQFLGRARPLPTEARGPIEGDFRGLPPVLLQVGDAEILLDDSVRTGQRLREAGVESVVKVWPEMFHAWQFFADSVPEGSTAIEEVGEFLNTKMDSAPDSLESHKSNMAQ